MKNCIIFIRKGSCYPFSTSQYTGDDITNGALPGFRVRSSHGIGLSELSCDIEVLAVPEDHDDARVSVSTSRVLWTTPVAGLDHAKRPSFLSFERFDESGYSFRGIEDITFATETKIEKLSVVDAEAYAADFVREIYIAHWSLVSPGVSSWRKSKCVPALYERRSTYRVALYRSLAKPHFCIGDPFDRQSELVSN